MSWNTFDVPAKRAVAAFEERAMRYEQRWLGRLHHEIAERTAEVALRYHPVPTAILDVGCGTGYLLRVLARRRPDAARRSTRDPRIVVAEGSAERIPFSDDAFDLVVSTTSFDHWADQAAGIRECARVVAPRGHLVLADLFSLWLAPTLIGSRRSKARTRRRAGVVLNDAGLHELGWHSGLPPDQCRYSRATRVALGRRCLSSLEHRSPALFGARYSRGACQAR